MTIYGYARVSTDGQSLASQDAQLHAAGCEILPDDTDQPGITKGVAQADLARTYGVSQDHIEDAAEPFRGRKRGRGVRRKGAPKK
jgi:hypothetical protein